jgi:16S rRNA (uracil1498-N3)-methyltransferase
MIRLYVQESHQINTPIKLDEDHFHHVIRVLRKREGDLVHIFNEKAGEWLAQISLVSKKDCLVKPLTLIRPPEEPQNIWLAFGILKNEGLSFLLEKATELGVTHFQPLITAHSQRDQINPVKALRIMRDGIQQCERLDIPHLLSPLALDKFLGHLPQNVNWFCPLERKAEGLRLSQIEFPKNDVGFIVGPEGGFSEGEFKMFNAQQKVHRISLGKRILRAETAALACLAQIIE